MKAKGIKLIMLLAVQIFTFNTEVMAQQEQKFSKIKTVTTSQTINVSSDLLWEIISHPNIANWSTLLDSTEYFGEEIFKGVPWNKRISVVNAKGHHESHETLIAYAPSKREIKFESTQFPKFILSNETHWKVIDKGQNKSVLETTTIMKMKKFQAFFLKKPMLKAISKNNEGVFYDIKYYAENGETSPAKKARVMELQKAQTNQKTKHKVVKETITSDIINVSADSLWTICREFDKTGEWTSTLKHSYGTGKPQHEGATCSSRTCETNIGRGNKVVEELTMFSDEKKELAYNLTEGAPRFIILANNHWRIIEVSSNQSKIEMNVTLHMKRFAGFFLGGLIIKQMKKQVDIVQDELKTFAETGEVSEAKKKQISSNE